MATGIEMLGQMGTDQALAGPVQGGNMVVKPNQVPVGGAAMLAKALRGQADKGVGGMYVLPEQQESMPGFMQMAQQNVNEDMTRMARTVEAEAPPGHMLSYITPEEAGILKLLGGTGDINPVTGIPQFPQYGGATGASDEDERATAYGYRDEPRGETRTSREASGRDQEWTDRGRENVERMAREAETDWRTQRDIKAGGTQQPILDEVRKGVPIEEETVSTSVSEVGDKISKIKESLSEQEQSLVEQAQSELTKGNHKKAQSIINAINNENLNAIFDSYSPNKEDSEEVAKKKKNRFSSVMSLLSGNPLGLVGEIMGGPSKDDILAKLKAGDSLNPEEQNVAAGLMLANKDNPNVLTEEQVKMIQEGGGFTSEDKIKSMLESYHGGEKMGWKEGFKALGKGGAIRPDGSISLEGLSKGLSTADKRLMKDIDPAMWAKLNFSNTGGGHEALGQEQFITNKVDADGNKIALTDSEKAFNRSVMESREISSRQKDAYDRQQGGRPGGMGGGPSIMPIEEDIETVVEEGATTMPYTGPRTGGVETQVPLQRRFKTDPTQDVAQYTTTPRTQEDIYKYMTEGTMGEGIGLEPFSDYQKRRRKALGLEPLELWG